MVAFKDMKLEKAPGLSNVYGQMILGSSYIKIGA